MKKIIRWSFLLVIIVSCFYSCRLYDFRTPLVKNGITPEMEIRGKTLLKEMGKAHGIDNYKSKINVRFIIRDDWRGFLPRLVAMPWSKTNEQFQFDFLIDTNDSRLTFNENKHKGEVWGIQNWATYKEVKERLIFKQKNKIKFWLPTVQYFMEMPFAIQDAQIVSYAGEDTYDGQQYDLVFVSWGKASPQKDIDQYLLWINKETKRLDIAQFTVRDKLPSLTGTMHYKDYREVEGALISFEQISVSNLGETDKYFHKYTVEEVSFNVDIPKEKFYPNPSLIFNK